jgi:hypothetical protein
MNIKEVCKNVGWDGESYFCMRCKKAGFATKAQAVGHQSQCSMNNKSFGFLPPPTTTTDHHHTTTTTPPDTTTLPPPDMVLPSNLERHLAVLGKQLAEIQQGQAKITNETAHTIAVSNQGFLGISKEGWVIIGVVALVAYMLGRETKTCDCSIGDYRYKRSGNGRSGFGSAMAGKIAGKFIDRIF